MYIKAVFKNIKIVKRINFQGLPFFNINGKLFADEGVTFVSSHFFNPVGLSKRCGIFVSKNGLISIGKNSGLSGVTLVSWNKIIIGENCGIGGNVSIWDTDFHGINYKDRTCFEKVKTEPVIIGNNVWIGANVIILKGTEIGDNSVIGAGSVVVGSKIRSNEIWAGNPAKFIKMID
jgi:acetyltransferase-like isoleucine patch superfamily enzyme